MFTGGLAGIGSFYDLLTLPIQVREANLRAGYRDAIWDRTGYDASAGVFQSFLKNDSGVKRETIEQAILKTAKKNNGVVTPSEVALNGGFDLDEAKKLWKNWSVKDMRR